MARMSGEQRRPQIAAAALKIIAERGPAGFTTRALSHEVGLAEGTIFRHFGSKEEIVSAAIDHLEEMFAKDLTENAGGDPVERLGRFFRRRVSLITRSPGVVRILFSDELARAGAETEAARIRRIKRQSRGFIADCIREAAAAGRLRPGLSPEALPLIVHGAALAVLFGACEDAGGARPLSPEALWETLATLLFEDGTGTGPHGDRA